MTTLKKRAILSVINDLSTDQRVHKVCLFLQKVGYDVLLVGRKQRSSQALSPRLYKTKRMKLIFEKGSLFYAEYNFRLLLLLLFTKADVLVANDLDTLLANFLISKVKRAKLVYDSHEYFTEVPELQGRKFKQALWRGLEKFILPKIKYSYTVDQSIANIYNSKYGTQMAVVRNFPALNNETKSNGDRVGELMINENKRIILYQGAVNMDRGLEEVITAMQFIDNAVLLIIGGGDILDDLKTLSQTSGVSDKVIFKGRLPFQQLKQFTQMADIGLSLEKDTNLSYHYTLPNKIFDYIHSGVPVLASPLPEIKNIFNKYYIGELIENHRPKHIADKINSMLSSSEKMQQWKENTRKAAMDLCWENEEKTLMKIYETVYNEQ